MHTRFTIKFYIVLLPFYILFLYVINFFSFRDRNRNVIERKYRVLNNRYLKHARKSALITHFFRECFVLDNNLEYKPLGHFSIYFSKFIEKPQLFPIFLTHFTFLYTAWNFNDFAITMYDCANSIERTT